MHHKLIKLDGYNFRQVRAGYYACNRYPLGERMLHRYVWTKHNGKIPKGMVINHKDINKENNDISNLQMLTPEEHMKMHFLSLPIGIQQKITRKVHNSHTGLVDIECQVCGVHFKGFPGRDKYCSASCKKIGVKKHAVLVTRICPECGCEFITPKNKQAKYCSSECFKRSFKGVSTENRHRKASGLPLVDEKLKSAWIERTCECCGKKFLVSPYSKQTTCSHKCGGTIWRKKRSEPVKPKKTECTCINCGAKFMGRKGNKYCSSKCNSAWRRKSGLDDVELTCCICGKKFKRNKYAIPKGQTEFACDGVCTAYLVGIRKRENIIKTRGTEGLLDQRKPAPSWVLDNRVKR